MRARTGNLCMAEAVPFGQKWTYHTDRPLDMVLSPDYFKAERYKLRVGDELRVCRIVEDRVREMVDLLIIENSDPVFEMVEVGERREFPDVRKRVSPVDHAPRGERYIGANGSVRWNPGRKVHEVFEGDKLVAASQDKDLAWEMARGSVPLPALEEAA